MPVVIKVLIRSKFILSKFGIEGTVDSTGNIGENKAISEYWSFNKNWCKKAKTINPNEGRISDFCRTIKIVKNGMDQSTH